MSCTVRLCSCHDSSIRVTINDLMTVLRYMMNVLPCDRSIYLFNHHSWNVAATEQENRTWLQTTCESDDGKFLSIIVRDPGKKLENLIWLQSFFLFYKRACM